MRLCNIHTTMHMYIRTLMFTCIVCVLVGMCLCIVANTEQKMSTDWI